MGDPLKKEATELKGVELMRFSRVLKSLANPTRLFILTLLIEKERNVKELGEITGQTQPNVSRYLTNLMENGLVVRRKEGVKSYFTIKNEDDIVRIFRTLKKTVNRRKKG